MSDGELLAVLLRIGKSGQSAEEMGRHLLTKFKGISGIDRAHFEELLAVPGMGIAKTAQLKAAIEIGKRTCRQNAKPKGFSNAAEVVAYIRPRFEGRRQEYLRVLTQEYGYVTDQIFVTHNSRETKYWRVKKDKMPGYIEEIENIPHVDATDKEIEELFSKLRAIQSRHRTTGLSRRVSGGPRRIWLS